MGSNGGSRRVAILFLGLSVIAAGLATTILFVVFQQLQNRIETKEVEHAQELVKVVVSTRTLEQGTTIKPEDLDKFLTIEPEPAKMTYYFSNVDPYEGANERYPLFKYLDGVEVVLEPGDLLWNPPFYWHHVLNQSESIGMGFRFNSVAAAMRSSMLLTFLRFFATEPNIFKCIYYAAFKNRNLLFTTKSKSLQDT